MRQLTIELRIIELLGLLGLPVEQAKTARRSELVENSKWPLGKITTYTSVMLHVLPVASLLSVIPSLDP